MAHRLMAGSRVGSGGDPTLRNEPRESRADLLGPEFSEGLLHLIALELLSGY